MLLRARRALAHGDADAALQALASSSPERSELHCAHDKDAQHGSAARAQCSPEPDPAGALLDIEVVVAMIGLYSIVAYCRKTSTSLIAR